MGWQYLNPFRTRAGSSRFPNLSSQDLGGLIRSFVFFILFYLYLWLDVDLRLIYSGGGVITNFPVFFKGWAFFQKFISYPGGPVEYTAAFLSQFLHIGWAGALVVTLQAWLICVCTGYFLKAINYPRLRWVRFVPPILLLIIYSQYAYHFVTTMALLAALIFVCLYLKMVTKGPRLGWFHLAVFFVLSVILYYVAGGAYLLFAVLCATYELLFIGRWQMGLLYLLSAAVIPYAKGVLIFGVSIIDAFSDLLPFSWKIISYESRKRMVVIIYILYLLLPLTTLAGGLWRKFRISTPASQKQEQDSKTQIRVNSWLKKPKLRYAVESLLLFGIAFAAVFFSHDNKRKTELEVDYYARHRMWPQVLVAARRHPDSFPIIHAVNRALYHTGRLGYEMFSHLQHPDALFLTAEGYKFTYWKKFDFYSDIGLMNLAENALVESMEIYGEHPVILKRLALVNMVKGNIGAARIYLGALSKTLFCADWANDYLARLQSDPNLSTDDRIQHLRSLMLEKDYGFFSFEIEDILLDLLEKNSRNRMAFEYLMAWYMLNKRLDKFIQNTERLDDFDYREIPRAYEEAMLVYVHSMRKAVDLRGRRLNPISRQRFEGFNQVLNRYGGNKDAAFDELAKNYRNTYFFYYLYAHPEKEK